MVDGSENTRLVVNVGATRFFGAAESNAIHNLDCQLDLCFSVDGQLHLGKRSPNRLNVLDEINLEFLTGLFVCDRASYLPRVLGKI